MVSAPYAAKLMADMGAEVIKVERPGNGDKARMRGPFPGHLPHPEKSGLFLYLNANKYGVTLDIAKPDGMQLLERLVEQVRAMLARAHGHEDVPELMIEEKIEVGQRELGMRGIK